MEGILVCLRSSVGDQEFIKLTKTVLRIVQNVLNEPENDKFRRVRSDSKVSRLFPYDRQSITFINVSVRETERRSQAIIRSYWFHQGR